MKKLIVLFMTFACLLTACTTPESTEIVSSDDVLKPLTIGVMPDVGAAPFILAKNNGYYEELGLDLTIQVFRSAIDRDTALQTGNLDGVMADMLPVVFFNDNDFDMTITSGTYGNYRMVTSPMKNTLKVEDLSTESIGLSSNTVIEFATDYILDSYDITSAEKIAVPKIPLRLEMLKTGDLDIATLPEPLASAAILEGGIILKDTETLEMNPGVFIFSDRSIEEKKASIKALYTGYNLGVDYINEESLDSYFDLMVERLGFPPVLKGQYVMPEMHHASMPLESDFNTVLEWMTEKDLTTSSYTLESLSTSEFISTK